MSADFRTSPNGGTASAIPPLLLRHALLTKRRHVDLMRVCTDACRSYAMR